MGDDKHRLLGGKIGHRDQWFGLENLKDFSAFRHWWHRVGKRDIGRNIESRSEAETIYRHWIKLGSPRIK